MKIGFIAPALDLDRERKGERIFLLPPLTFPVLAALTPPDIEVKVIEERVQPIPYEEDFDLVGITFVTAFAPHAYEIADRFRQKGVTVVLGGPHVSVMPQEALQHAEAVVVGEAEEIWPRLIDDFRRNNLQPVYRQNNLSDLSRFPRPRLEVIPKEFAFRNSTLASKGCPFKCNFCFVNMFNGYRQRFRPVEDVIADLERMEGNPYQRKRVIFWDDNINGHPAYLKKLLREMIPLKKKWASAASATIANDPELLDLLEKSGCTALFIGMESINTSSLRESAKYHNRVANYREMVKRLHDHGIALTGAFVFGFDQDDADTFDRTLEMMIDIELDCMTPAILTPLPGTPLYRQMAQQGRIFDHNWGDYDYFHVVFRPKQMSPEQLYEGFLEFNRRFFSYGSIFKRLSRSQTHLTLTILANLGYHGFYKRMIREYRQGLRAAYSEFSDQPQALAQPLFV